MDCDYLITPFCFYKAWNTYLKTGFGYVWIQYLIDFVEISDDFTNTDADLEPFSFISGTFWMLAWNLLDFISGTSWFYFCKPLSWMTDDFLFAQHVGLNSPDFIFAFWGSVAWVPLISFYFSGVQPHLGAPQGDNITTSPISMTQKRPPCASPQPFQDDGFAFLCFPFFNMEFE